MKVWLQRKQPTNDVKNSQAVVGKEQEGLHSGVHSGSVAEAVISRNVAGSASTSIQGTSVEQCLNKEIAGTCSLEASSGIPVVGTKRASPGS